MKTIRIIAIAAAVASLAACSKEAETVVNANHFEKGQKVTLGVKAGEPSTKVSSELNTGTGKIDFKWEKGDKIKVTVNGQSAEFTLKGDGGSNEGYFEGEMPAGGETFDVQYPVNDPFLTNQTYSSTEAIPHDMIKFAATGCSTSSSFTIVPQYSAMRLNLWGTGQTISKIVVTNTSSTETTKPTFTLSISPAVPLTTDSSNPMPFLIVVPAGSYSFSAEIINAATDSASGSATPPADAIQNGVFTVGATNVFTTSSAKTFTAGKVLIMDAKQVDFTKVYFSKGNLYYDGSFKFEDTQYAYTKSYKSSHVCRFRWANNSGALSTDINSAIGTGTSMSGCSKSDVFFTNATVTTPRTNFTVAGQTGVWRTLSGGSGGEWSYLLNMRSVNGGTGEGKSYQRATINSDETGVYGLIIYPDNYTSQSGATSYTTDDWSNMEKAGCVFLPAAGRRSSQSLTYIDLRGHYWSSSPYSTLVGPAYYLYFYSGSVSPAYNDYRTYGLSVRLVSAAQ